MYVPLLSQGCGLGCGADSCQMARHRRCWTCIGASPWPRAERQAWRLYTWLRAKQQARRCHAAICCAPRARERLACRVPRCAQDCLAWCRRGCLDAFMIVALPSVNLMAGRQVCMCTQMCCPDPCVVLVVDPCVVLVVDLVVGCVLRWWCVGGTLLTLRIYPVLRASPVCRVVLSSERCCV
jgi:hypothetical protein